MAMEKPTDPVGGVRRYSTQCAPLVQPRLYILSDVCLLCEGLALALLQQSSVKVVGSSDLSTSPASIAERRPDVLLLDIAMAGSLDICPPLCQLLPALKIVAIAVAEVEQEIIACAEAGVSGFVSRKGSVQDVMAAIHSAMRGELVCSPRTAAALCGRVGTLAANRSNAAGSTTLTRREHEIASLVSEGRGNKEIARVLRIQNATVKNHIHSISRQAAAPAPRRGGGAICSSRIAPLPDRCFYLIRASGPTPSRVRSPRPE
jgi:DNA-binding NarL/FixJ family response regulator